jgi:hypothetical protein
VAVFFGMGCISPRTQFKMKTIQWKIRHKPTALTLSGEYTMSGDGDEMLENYIKVTTADFQQFMGYGDDDDYEIEITKN